MFSEVGHGEQSIVGFLKFPNNDSKFIKVARDSCFLIQHEYQIMKSLQNFNHLKPFFCNAIKLSTVYSDPVVRIKSENQITGTAEPNLMPKIALELEFISKSIALGDLIPEEKKNLKCIWPLIQQVAAITRMAHETLQFTHYDLHSDNVLVKKVERPTGGSFVRIFKFLNGDINIIQCDQYEPIIIDFGRAFCNILEDTPINIELFNTHAGLFSVVPNALYDQLFFLNSCAQLLKDNSSILLYKNLKPYLKNVDENGWWKSNRLAALEIAASLIKLKCEKSILFGDNLSQALIIFSHLCIIPLKTQNEYPPTSYWPYYFLKFYYEWIKFEKWFNNDARLIYFWCFFVSLLNLQREAYFETIERAAAQNTIRIKINEFLNIECDNQWRDDDINWFELIRCGYLAGQMLENLLCDVITKQEQEFAAQHNSIRPADLFHLIPKTFDKNEKIAAGELIDATSCQITRLTSAQVKEWVAKTKL